MEDDQQIVTPPETPPQAAPPPQTPQQGDPAETYYNYLKKAGADVPSSVESFKKTLADENSARQYYSYLKSNHFDAPDTYESFAKTLGSQSATSPAQPAPHPQEGQPIPQGGPTPQQTKMAINAARGLNQPDQKPPAPVSKNPASKPFADLEADGNAYVDASKNLHLAQSGSAPQQTYGAPGMGGGIPANEDVGAQLRQQIPQLQQQTAALKDRLTQHEAAASGTMKDIVDGFAKDYKNYITSDGVVDQGKVREVALNKAREYGGDRYVAETIFNQASNAIKFQDVKPEVDGEFKKMTGKMPDEYLGGITGAQYGGLKALYTHDFEAEAKRSQDLISQKANSIFAEKYQPILEHTAQMFGGNSEQYQQALVNSQRAYGEDLRGIQMQENARLLRVRAELNRNLQAGAGKIAENNQGLMDQYTTLYNKAFQTVQQNRDDMRKMGAYTPGQDMTSLFMRSMWSGLNSWASTRGAGLVAAGFNNPFTDWLRNRGTAAEANAVPDGSYMDPRTWAAKAGGMVGSMLPDLAVTAITKNPTFAGLEFTASSTVSGMGDVYNQGISDGYTPAEASAKAQEFAHANFLATLPGNMLMGSAILANLKGVGGFIANTAKEAAGGLGASLPQQYLEQAKSKEGKTLGQFLREDAPQSALETVIALAAGAPVMRAVGHLTKAMGDAKVQGQREQFFSDIIDKQGLQHAQAAMESLYINGVLDKDGLAQGKQMLDKLVATKTGLQGLGVHPDLQKLYLANQAQIESLQASRPPVVEGSGLNEAMHKMYDARIKEVQGQMQDIVNGKTSYIKLTTPTGTDFVVHADQADAVLNDPTTQRDIADGHLRAQAFGDEKDITPLTERINEITAAKAPSPDLEQPAIEAPIKPQITEVRHGETEEDKTSHVSGPDGIPLNEEGKTQAEDLADQSMSRGFTKVAGSDVPRNIATSKAVADKLGIPHEIIPGLNSWDIGQWNGEPESDYVRAESYFVNHPDATQFEGKTINESFNQYKERILKARQELEDKNQGNTLLVNHSGNMKIWEAYQKSGGVWDEAAKAHYLTSLDAEVATLPPDKREEEAIADAENKDNHPAVESAFREEDAIGQASDPVEHNNIAKLFIEENEKLDKEQPAGPVRGGGEPEPGSGEANGEDGRTPSAETDKESVRANDEGESGKIDHQSGTDEPVPGGGSAGDKPERDLSREEFEAEIAKPQYARAPGMIAAGNQTPTAVAPAAGATTGPEFDDTEMRKLIHRAPADYTDDEISDLMQHIGGWDKADADRVIQEVRGEQAKGAKQLIKDAIAKGQQIAAGAAKLQTATPSSFIKKLSRWFMDKIDDVADVKGILRKNSGAQEHELDQIWHASQKLLNEWNTVPKEDRLAFILGMERPDLRQGWTDKQKDMADQYRQRLDKIHSELTKALPNLNFLEDYFPHFWDKPDDVKNYFASTLGKTPMEGSKSFAKERMFGTILPGLEKGYSLSTDNPEELVRLAEANAWKFITAKNVFSDMQKMGYLKYSTDKSLPADWKSVDDKLFNRIGAYVDKSGEANLTMGSYMMPPDVAKLMNDYLSPGLKGPVKSMIQNWNNLKNSFQLGLGAFHYATTSLESIASGMVRGVQLISTLNPKNMVSGAGHILGAATFLPNIAMDLRRGWKTAADWKAGNITADVQASMDANARVAKQRMYSLEAKYNMQKAFGLLRADSDFGQIPKVIWNGLLYAPEMMNKFLMEKWVPGLKMGGYLRSLDAELQARKNMSPAEIQRAKEKTWDSMDDRLGQVVYDNRFFNKSVKDLGFLSVRSLGWTGGTISALANGIGEIPLSVKRAVKGQGITQNTAYLAALPMMAGLYGAFFHMMHTGQAPQSAQDYFFPKDGTKNADGTDHRIALPTYLKDVLAYSKSPATTLLHKTAPLVSDVTDVYNNKDFYGEQIYGPDDNVFQQGVDVLKHQAEGMTPFSLRQRPGDDKTFRQGTEQVFGMMPAPRERERSDIQNKIMSAVGANASDKAKTHEEMEQYIARRQLREHLFNGGSWEDAPDDLKSKANVSESAQDKFISDSKIDPYERSFKSLPRAKKIELYQQMSDDEKQQYKKYLPEEYNPNE